MMIINNTTYYSSREFGYFVGFTRQNIAKLVKKEIIKPDLLISEDSWQKHAGYYYTKETIIDYVLKNKVNFLMTSNLKRNRCLMYFVETAFEECMEQFEEDS